MTDLPVGVRVDEHKAVRRVIVLRVHHEEPTRGQKLNGNDLRFTFERQHTKDALPYWQQGDEELDSTENLQRRYQLRQHPDVVEVLQMWWSTAQCSMPQGGATTLRPADRHHPDLAREDYVFLSVSVYRVMIEEYDEHEARQCAHDDWEHDSRGEPRMLRAALQLAPASRTQLLPPSHGGRLQSAGYVRLQTPLLAQGAPRLVVASAAR